MWRSKSRTEAGYENLASDRARSISAAGGHAGSAAAVGPDVFRTQLRFSTGVVGASSGGPGSDAVRCIFDRVNLYKLRAQVAKRVEGKRPLKIRAFSNAGARENGLVSPSVRSERAGHRVMKSITAIRHAKAQGKRDEERGGETTGAEVPSIQLYRRTKGQASNCAEGLGSFLSSESGRARPLRVLHKLRILTADLSRTENGWVGHQPRNAVSLYSTALANGCMIALPLSQNLTWAQN